ncbi:hypothetical protein PRZ48_004431 [Zasmidium cellare]|uniref:Uncharacterized protein n=1 Tax=Zasmidium cellare TaxID=395010 RepID=A0ABR0EQJ4_ZASCE|nr:hypothetical protein PRZ48_004431 [Zasmidium cellare]
MARHKNIVPSGPAQPQDRCHLFRLPAEIRNSIYSLALAVKPDQRGYVAIRRRVSKPGSVLELLGTCRIIYQEASGLFYGEHRLFIDFWYLGHSPSALTNFKLLGKLSPLRLNGLRDLTVAFELFFPVLEDITRFIKEVRVLPALKTLVIKIEADEHSARVGGMEIARMKQETALMKRAVKQLRSVETFRFFMSDELIDMWRQGKDWQKLLHEVAAAHPSNKPS